MFIQLSDSQFTTMNHTCCERHLVLVEAVEHEDGDVEEHDGWVLDKHVRSDPTLEAG